MGQLNCGGALNHLPHFVDLSETAPQQAASRSRPSRPRDLSAAIAQKGLTIWVDSVDDLVRALPFELDADLDHLHSMSSSTAQKSSFGSGVEGQLATSTRVPGSANDPTSAQQQQQLEMRRSPPDFARDVGVQCKHSIGADRLPRAVSDDSNSGFGPLKPEGFDMHGGQGFADNQDNYACVQVDDANAAWGLYAVADGHGPHGHLISTLLVHELPGLLAQNPNLHSHSSMALHQAFVAVGEMASSCQFVDASVSGGTLSAVLLRDGFLHVSWVGDSKVVLGRLATKPPPSQPWMAPQGTVDHASLPATSRRFGHNDFGNPQGLNNDSFGGVHPQLLSLRAVDLTSEQAGQDQGQSRSGKWSSRGDDGWADSADGAGGPPEARSFGNSTSRGGTSSPEVRRMRLKSEDVFMILGTAGLWKRINPAEAVTIVSHNLHRMAADAAYALAAVADQRAVSSPSEDVTALVVYLAGDSYVTDFDIRRAYHLPERRDMDMYANDLAGVQCDGWLNGCSRRSGLSR